MNTPQNTKNITEFSDEMGNTFKKTSNIIDFINMQKNNILLKKKQNNILLNKNTPTSKQ
jgi:hypothetical protein